MKGMTNDMNEIIVYHDPLEAWFWTHMEISIPVTLIIVIVIAMNWHQKSQDRKNKWRD